MRPRSHRVLVAIVVAALLTACSSNGSDMTLEDARDELRTVLTDLATALEGDVTVVDERIVPAAESLAAEPDELRYELSLDVAARPEAVRSATDELARRYREDGFDVDIRDDDGTIVARFARDGLLAAVRAGGGRGTALVSGTSRVVATPDGVDPVTTRIPFPAFTPPA